MLLIARSTRSSFGSMSAAALITSVAGCLLPAALTEAQVRVAAWNVTTYSSGRVNEFKSAFYDTAPSGLRFLPDIVILQEVVGSTTTAANTSQTNFLAILNGYTDGLGTPGPRDWAVSPVQLTSVNPGSNHNLAMFYRTSKITFVSQTALTTNTGSGPTQPPRDTARWLVRMAGYSTPAAPGTGPELYLYGAHMKSASGTEEQNRRQAEATRLRTDSNALPAGANFLIGGDFNIQSSSQAAFVTMTSTGTSAAGRFIDPINSPGSWNNTCSFRYIFTQDPSTTGSGGMDDRLDFILISPTLADSAGLGYIGNTAINYNNAATARAASANPAINTTPWDVPDHSYRSWGNDGFICNSTLRTTGNSMVGPAIAANLVASTNIDISGGHLPVYLDLRVPPKAAVSTVTINFGSVPQNSVQTAPLTVTNTSDVRAFARDPVNNGALAFETLNYTFSVLPASFTLTGPAANTLAVVNQPALPAAAVQNSRTHTITFLTGQLGTFSGSTVITSNAPGTPSFTVNFTGTVVSPVVIACTLADVASDSLDTTRNPNNAIGPEDLDAFISGFIADNAAIADVASDSLDTTYNPNGAVGSEDLDAFIASFIAGC